MPLKDPEARKAYNAKYFATSSEAKRAHQVKYNTKYDANVWNLLRKTQLQRRRRAAQAGEEF